jgi:FkbM family methyltransferase
MGQPTDQLPKLNLIDVGAVQGLDVPWKHHAHRVGHLLSFEPNDAPQLAGQHLKYNTAVWNYDGQGTFYISGANGVGSSLLRHNEAWVRAHYDQLKHQGNPQFNATWFERSRVLRTVPVQVRKLDTILAEVRQQVGPVPFHFLKSDTQSGEGHVLQGAAQFVRDECLGLELEMFRYPMYEGVILEDEVIATLEQFGFVQLGWTGYLYSFHAACDRLFVRREPRNATEAALIGQIKEIYRPANGLIKQPTRWKKFKTKIRQALSL